VKTRMKEYRAGLGLTQEKLAEMVGVRRETIIYLEKGKYNPSLKLARDIALVLNASIEEIFIFDDE
jgi:putative transcriptional regulator